MRSGIARSAVYCLACYAGQTAAIVHQEQGQMAAKAATCRRGNVPSHIPSYSSKKCKMKIPGGQTHASNRIFNPL